MKRNLWLRLFNIVLCTSIILGMVFIPSGLAHAQEVVQPSVSPEDTDPSLVGWWQMEEGSGITTADSSGNGNTGTLVNDDGTMWVTDRFGNPGKALHFNGVTTGTGQYVKVNDSSSLDITGDITIAAWVKPGQVLTQDLVKKTGTNSGYELTLSTGVLTPNNCTPSLNPCTFGRFNASDSFRVNSYYHYTASDPWTFYALTYTSTDNTMRLYKDGILDNSRVPTTQLTINANDSFLGFGATLTGPIPTASRWFKGSLDDIRIYNRALSLTEIQILAGIPFYSLGITKTGT